MHVNRIKTRCKRAHSRTFYAGSQSVGEVRNQQLSHSLMTGLQMDEHIARIALNQGATQQVKTYLTDALGSVIATAKADQSLEVGYVFSPYGQTQKVGVENQLVGSENSSQYTGRENDNNGLYFYRARYYDPVLKRFISEDPTGLGGGANVYSYVGGNPVSMLDPTGLVAWNGTVGGVGAISGFGGAMYFFDLTSECKCNIQIRVRGYASFLAIGVGMTATASGGSSSFTDPFECPASNSANGYAGAISATVVTVGGASYGSMRLGSLSNSASLSTGVVGLDISAGFYQGASVVTSSELKPCQCEAK